MILEEFVSYYRTQKSKRGHAKEILIDWLKKELNSIPQKNYQKVLHNELEIVDEDFIVPKNVHGEALLSSLLRIINIIEEKEYESSFASTKSKDYLHA